MIYYAILLVGTALGAAASMLFKRASGTKELWRMALQPSLWAGGMLYLLSAVIDIYVLRYLDYSVAMPLTAVTYIWTMLLSYFLLKEHISRKKLAGVGLILLGAVFITM